MLTGVPLDNFMRSSAQGQAVSSPEWQRYMNQAVQNVPIIKPKYDAPNEYRHTPLSARSSDA